MNKAIFKKVSAGIVGTALAVMSIPALPSTFADQKMGTLDGYDWEMWEEYGQGSYSMTPGSKGTYKCSWSGIHNILFRSGKKWKDFPQWDSLGTIELDYDVDYRPNGNSYLCVYGWMKNPTVEYYICESYGTWRPPGNGFSMKGTKVINGGTYEIYEGRHTGPSIFANSETFNQYWSIRLDGQKSTKGTITVSDHFKAWEACGIKLGGLYEVALNVEGWESSGTAEVKKNDLRVGGEATPTEPTEPPKVNDEGYWFHNTFESGAEDWSGRGDASAKAGSGKLNVTGRTNDWNGAIRSLGSEFVAGESYSFSVNAGYDKGDATRDFKLTLEYNNGTETTWDEIATGTTYAGKWVQLTNTNYKLPAGSDYKLIVETCDGTLEDFYIDEAIGAPAGTKIDGPGKPDLSDIPQPTTQQKPGQFIPGDVTCDGKINTFDLVAMRKAVVSEKFASDNAKYASDVDADGSVGTADLVLLSNYLLGKDVELKKAEMPVSKMRTISEYTPVVEKMMVETEPGSSHQNKGGVGYGKIEKKSYYSDFCKRTKKYNVLLPDGYSESKQYPVLYVLHGYYENPDRMITTGNGQMYTQQILGNLIAEGAAKEMILVFPHVYSSATQDDVSGMDDNNNRAYDNFDTVLVNELMPLIEKDYSVATGRENTAITGFSMGGRESLQIGMKHPDLFGYVGAICPAPGTSGAWKFASEEESPSIIMITGGGQDDVVYNNPETYKNNFQKNNVPVIWHYVKNGHHGDDSIHAHYYNFFRAVFNA